jgi:serine/threonine protein kinase
MSHEADTAHAAAPTSSGATSGSRPIAIGPGTTLVGRYVIEKLAHRGPFAEVYQATDQTGGTPVSVHVLDPKLARVQRVAEVVTAASKAAIAIDHKNVVRTLDVATDAGHLFVITEYVEGSSLRELMERKQDAGSPGFGARGANNILGGVCDALQAAHDMAHTPHGAVSVDSVYVNKAGRVKVADFGLAAGLAVAVQTGVRAKPAFLSPEVAKSGHPDPAGDIFSVGMLLYQVLVGKELVKGGPRPSEVDEVGPAVDELVAHCAAPHASKRPKNPAAVRAALNQALRRPTGERPAVKPAEPQAPRGKARPSLAQAIAAPEVATKESEPFLRAIAQNEEKYLISKGKLDYGPFTLAHIIEDINNNLVVPGHLIIDKDTGERVNVEEHPLLAELVDEAKQRRDDQRRAQAEVAHSEQEKRRGFALYAFIAAAVIGVGGGAFLIYRTLRSTGFSPSVVAEGGGGSTRWEYAIVAITEDGANRKVSRKRTLEQGAAELTAKAFNRITWPAIDGAVRYEVYRTVAGGAPTTTGRIASVEPTVLEVADTGLEGDGTSLEARLSALAEGSLQARITFPTPPSRKPHKQRHSRSPGSSGDDGDDGDDGPGGPLDMSDDGDTEILDGSQINPVIQRNGGKLARCLLSSGASRADIEFSIKNTGRVAKVTVYNANAAATSCIEKVVRSMKFPSFNGTFTNASFDMAL